MKNTYPNLELLEYIFRQQAWQKYKKTLANARFPVFRAKVFIQSWPNTAHGFDGPGVVSGQALTDAYTTVFEMRWTEKERGPFNLSDHFIYGVFFENKFAYCVCDPPKVFFDDLKNERMASVHESTKYFEKQC